MNPRDFLEAARVPASVAPQEFGLWTIQRAPAPRDDLMRVQGLEPIGWPDFTILKRLTLETLHDPDGGEIVMEDSRRELKRHLPIWLAAHGRILVTGLGLGCVVRGLLASPAVEHVDVVELDPLILKNIGEEFRSSPRCTLHRADALAWQPPAGSRWDFAWHDLWTEEGAAALHCQHIQLFGRFRKMGIPIERQGAWAFPRFLGAKIRLLGAPRARDAWQAI